MDMKFVVGLIVTVIIIVVIIFFAIAFLGPQDSPIIAAIRSVIDQALGLQPDI